MTAPDYPFAEPPAPGTTREVLLPILESTGLHLGVDFFVAFGPEREDPGNTRHSGANIPKVVGGSEQTSLDLAQCFYERAFDSVVPVSSCEAAEATKMLAAFPRQVRPVGVNMISVSQARQTGGGGWAEWTRACCGSRNLIDEYTDPSPEELEAAGRAYRPQQAHIESTFTVQTPANVAMHGGTPGKT